MNNELIRKILQLYRSNKRLQEAFPELKALALKFFGWQTLSEFSLVGQVYFIKFYVDAVTNHDLTRLYSLPVAAWLIYRMGLWLHEQQDNCKNDFYMRFRSVLWSEAHRKELTLSTDWHIAHGTGEKEAIIAKNTNKVDDLVDAFLFRAFPLTLRLVLTTPAMFLLGAKYGFLALATVASYIWQLRRNEPLVSPMHAEFNSDNRKLELFGSELTQNWRPIRAFGIEDYFADRNEQLLRWAAGREHTRHRAWRKIMLKLDIVVITYSAALFGVVINAHASDLGSIALAIAWMQRIYSNFYNLSDFQRSLYHGKHALGELLDIMLTVPTVRQSVDPVWPKEICGQMEFRNLCFGYREESPILSNINLRVEANQIVALIGKTGSGKTTLASLAQREFDPIQGSIMLDGLDLRTLDFRRYRREAIAVVHQHSSLFDDTIANNITISRELTRIEEDLQLACRQAFLEEFLERLPLGLETMIGENGIRLSGGQRQRIAIARALYRKPKILILDEPTSALDPDSQAQVQKAIDELIRRRTCTILIIAHRFSTIENADKIVVLDAGRIVEIGTHEELSRKNGLYSHFKNLEMGGALV
ncbi:MAG: ABC transporter ATP-binding protein/permease [Candidatus Doudnabacteria bacterium]|nr:ABC transporter ATP-binding protein/permease [Candidatus Doudnabacteria bacterium]